MAQTAALTMVGIVGRQRVISWLTAVATVAWVGTLIARAVNPAFNAGAGADAVMLLVIGWWFTTASARLGGSR